MSAEHAGIPGSPSRPLKVPLLEVLARPKRLLDPQVTLAQSTWTLVSLEVRERIRTWLTAALGPWA